MKRQKRTVNANPQPCSKGLRKKRACALFSSSVIRSVVHLSVCFDLTTWYCSVLAGQGEYSHGVVECLLTQIYPSLQICRDSLKVHLNVFYPHYLVVFLGPPISGSRPFPAQIGTITKCTLCHSRRTGATMATTHWHTDITHTPLPPLILLSKTTFGPIRLSPHQLGWVTRTMDTYPLTSITPQTVGTH